MTCAVSQTCLGMLEYRYDVCCVSNVFERSWSTDMTCSVSQTCLGGAGVPI